MATNDVLAFETPFGKPVSWAEVGMITDVGTSHPWNDDRCLVVTVKDMSETQPRPWREFMLCLVADGASGSHFSPGKSPVEAENGGNHAGWRASQIAQGAFVERFLNSGELDVLDRLKEGLRAADAAIQDRGEGTLTTTLTVLFLSADGTACAASIGDSVLAVLPPEHKSIGSKRPKKLGYEESTSVGTGETRSTRLNQAQLIEDWWPNKEDSRGDTRVRPGTYLVLMSDGISDSLNIPFIEEQLRRHPLDRVTVGLPTYTREYRALENKRTGASTSELGLDNMSAIVVRYDGLQRRRRLPNVPRVEDASFICAMGTYGGPNPTSGGQFGLICLAGQDNGATAVPEFLRQFLDSEHRMNAQLRLEKAWLDARAPRNQSRFSVLYSDDRGSSFTFANAPQ